MNRAARRLPLFSSPEDYEAFDQVLCEAGDRVPMRLLDYAGMPTHFHLVLWPRADSDLSRYMQRLTMVHVQRWHKARGTTGCGTLYQGRFKAIPVQADGHFLRLCRYVERNPVRGGLVNLPTEWPWGSAYRRQRGGGPRLDEWPIAIPHGWTDLVAEVEAPASIEEIRECLRLGRPFGAEHWCVETAERLPWCCGLRPRGRPPGSKTQLE
jgi:putative transposase